MDLYGALSGLRSLASDVLLEEVLSYSKHQVLEGMVFEQEVDRRLLGASMPNIVEPVPCQAMVARIGASKCFYAFVWFTKESPWRNEVLERLSRGYKVVEVSYDISVDDFRIGEAGSSGELLSGFLRRLSGKEPSLRPRNELVRDKLRQNSAIYGYLCQADAASLFNELVLPRVFRDFRIEPFSQGCWDLDRFVAIDGELWALEIKHKSPAPKGFFGLNTGQVLHVGCLLQCGFRYLHLIFVKPIWEKTYPTVRLLLDEGLRERFGIVGAEINREAFQKIDAQPTKKSGADTTLTGSGFLGYKELSLEHFYAVGLFSDTSEKIWRGVLGLTSGNPLGKPMNLERLGRLRVFR